MNNTKMNRPEQLKAVQKEAFNLFCKKNQDYGDSFATYGTVGVIVRLGDKIQRLLSVSEKGVTMVNTESLRDTLVDLHNYAAMGVMLMDEKAKISVFIPDDSVITNNEKIDDIFTTHIV
jgi:hypothetical protein